MTKYVKDKYDCVEQIFNKINQDHVDIYIDDSATIVTLKPSLGCYIKIPTEGEKYGIEMVLKDKKSGNEAPNDLKIKLLIQNVAAFIPKEPGGIDVRGHCSYKEFKTKFRPKNEIIIHQSYLLALVIEEKEYINNFKLDKIIFTVDQCCLSDEEDTMKQFMEGGNTGPIRQGINEN